ncbi:MAG: hypothetical protein CMB89_12160, partial [Flammeovirgaceae bacterium]|nr:hypothetical protein [Flammeovirgaceae bacterium]
MLTAVSVFAQVASDSTEIQDSTYVPEVLTPDYKEVDDKEILNIIDNMPVFGIYQDNYFTTGIPVNEPITPHTADAK